MGETAQEGLLFARAGRPGHDQGPRPVDPELGRQHRGQCGIGVAQGRVPLQVAAYHHPLGGSPQRDEPGAVGRGLRDHEVQPAEELPRKGPGTTVAPEAPLREAAVDHAQGDSAAPARGHEGRPQLQLGEHHQVGADGVQEPAHHPREVEGEAHDPAAARVDAPSALEAGRGAGADDDVGSGPRSRQRLDEGFQRVGLAHAHPVNEDPRAGRVPNQIAHRAVSGGQVRAPSPRLQALLHSVGGESHAKGEIAKLSCHGDGACGEL